MFVVVVMYLDGTVRDTVGPFWDEISAEAFGRRSVTRYGFRYTVRPMTERGVWLAWMTEDHAKGGSGND